MAKPTKQPQPPTMPEDFQEQAHHPILVAVGIILLVVIIIFIVSSRARNARDAGGILTTHTAEDRARLLNRLEVASDFSDVERQSALNNLETAPIGQTSDAEQLELLNSLQVQQ